MGTFILPMKRLYIINLLLMLCGLITAQHTTNKQEYAVMNMNKTASPSSINAVSGHIRFSICGNNLTDAATLGFDASASNSFDSGKDTLKLPGNDTLAPYIATVMNNQDYLSNFISANFTAVSIPLHVTVGVTGKYILYRDSSISFPPGICAFLEDKAVGYYEDFIAGSSYSFTIDDTTSAPRFVFHIMSGMSYQSINTTCSYNQNGSIIINGPAMANLYVTWMDAIGNVLSVHTTTCGNDTLSNLAPGKYPVSVVGNIGNCTSLTDTILVLSAPAFTISPVLQHVTCINANNGSINAGSVTGGTAPYSYAWSNNTNSSVNNNLSPGVYILYLTDANNCSDTSIYSIQQLSTLSAGFNLSADTVLLSNAIVSINNQSSGYTGLFWDFGDGNTLANVNSPSHTYLSAGIFTVELTASDNYCTEKAKKNIVVLNPLSVQALHSAGEINIFSNENKLMIQFSLPQTEKANIQVNDLSGKNIGSYVFNVCKTTEIIHLNDAAGVYIVTVTTSQLSTRKKIVLQ